MSRKIPGFRFAARLFLFLIVSLFFTSASGAETLEVNVTTSRSVALSGVNVYAFTELGSYTGKYSTTNANGIATFDSTLYTGGNYKFRADYLGYQFWSQVITIPDTLSVDVIIEEETAEVTVTTAAGPSNGVKVYLFTGAGSYLSRYGTTNAEGKTSFELPVGKDYKFRADILGSQYWSNVVTIQPGGTNNIAINAGGGVLQVTVDKGAGIPMAGINAYIFTASGAYLSMYQNTDASGIVRFNVSEENYKVRADYLGNQFWTSDTSVTGDTNIGLTIPHQDVVITVQGTYQTTSEAIQGINVYLFTSSGAYLSQYKITNTNGQVTFNLPQKAYNVRADYLGRQFWSGEFTWQDKTVNIPMADAEITVTGNGLPLQGVNVYVFTGAGSYLSRYGATDIDGKITFRLPAGPYKFRADYQSSQYWSDVAALLADQVNPVSISTGGGMFELTVLKGVSEPLVGMNCYVFNKAGTYLNLYATTNTGGEVSFSLADGNYKIRADYLGYQFWTDVYSIPTTLSVQITIPHQDVVITVQGTYQGTPDPIEGINVYLFTSSGSYMSQYKTTNTNGQATFSLPQQSYKVRADYLSRQFWSDAFTLQDTAVDIPMADAEITVTGNGLPLQGVNVYVFTGAGSYLSRYGAADINGKITFRLPAGPYKFRVDYQSNQYWSAVETLLADQLNPVSISTGGGIFELAVLQGASDPMSGVNCYVFNGSGAYLGLYDTTDSSGHVSFNLSDGNYKFRVDYLGNQFWTEIYSIPTTLLGTLIIPHQDVVITVQGTYQGASDPLSGVNVYLFTSSGSYMSRYVATDFNGQVIFNLPQQSYKVRTDYLGRQFWSDVFTWQDTAVAIPHGTGQIHVLRGSADVAGAIVYLFTESGSYLSRYQTTDASGMAEFLIPSGPYKFRADEGGDRKWSDTVALTAYQTTNLTINLATLPENTPPSIMIVEPDGVEDTTDTFFRIEWTDDDPDDNASVSLYYDNDDAGEDGIPITGSLSEDEDEAGDEYIWNTTNIEEGDYYIYAVIDDGINDPVTAYSPGALTIQRGVVIDKAKITAGDGAMYDNFGSSVSISGDYAIVGAFGDSDTGEYAGAAYIFRKQGSAWVKQVKLTPVDVMEYAQFGYSVSISGDYAIIGAPGDSGYSGAVYIYKRDGDTWIEQAKLTASDVIENAGFGSSVSISEDYMIVGAPYANEDYSGSAYIFKLDGAIWTEQAKLTASDAMENAGFGFSVSINGDYAIIGAPGDSDAGEYSGSAYIFKLGGDAWTEQIKLTAIDATEYAVFGSSVSISGIYAIVGAPYANEDYSGAAYVFKKDGDTWTEQERLTASDAGSEAGFGYSVSINENHAIVGEPYSDSDSTGDTGAIYLYTYVDGVWVFDGKITASDASEYDNFGTSVDIDNDFIIVGASYGDSDNEDDTGAAYIYPVSSYAGKPSIKIIKPYGFGDISDAGYIIRWTDNDSDNDASISLYYEYQDEPWILIADNISEDTDGDGDEYFWDTSLLPEGKYLLRAIVNDGINEPMTAYSGVLRVAHEKIPFSADNPAGFDFFGSSVAMDDKYMIVGSMGEDINGEDSGAAYIYKYDNGWFMDPEDKLIADDPSEYDYFGRSVAISGDIAVVGTPGVGFLWDYAYGPGAAYVFRKGVEGWQQEAKLIADDGSISDYFGWSVAIDGNYVIVGAWGKDDNGEDSGAAYIFKHGEEGWQQEAKLMAGDPPDHYMIDAYFGWSVSINGDYAVVGAYGDYNTMHDSGAAYVFKRVGSNWIQQEKLTTIDGSINYHFGYSVHIDGRYIIVGARGQDYEYLSPGAAYIFKRIGDDWEGQAILTAEIPENYDYFGYSVAIENDYAVVGSPGAYYYPHPGAAYVFEREGDEWTLKSDFSSDIPYAEDNYGSSVDISGGYALIGSPGRGYNEVENGTPGTVYSYLIDRVNISAEDGSIMIGDATTLTWDFINATTVTIDNSIGEVTENGYITIFPMETTTYTITAVGPWGTLTDSVTVVVNLIDISITYPSEGSTIYRPDTSVEGTIINPLGHEVGVNVNGMVAMVEGDHFVANHVPLEDGTNTITATIVDTDGNTATNSIDVYADTTQDYIRITADEESGVALFETTLRIETSFALTGEPVITNPDPGVIVISKIEDEYNYYITISSPGIYNITAEVEHEGYSYSDTITIQVLDDAVLDALLQAKWDGMKMALVDGDISRALTYHHESEKEDYEMVYNLIGIATIQAKAAQMQDIEPVLIEGDRAKYRIRRDNNFQGETVTMTYYIYFSKDSNGLWMIERY